MWSDRSGYAGSFDAVCRIEGERVLLDLKTTRSGVHADVALQLAAYARTEQLITQDGVAGQVPGHQRQDVRLREVVR